MTSMEIRALEDAGRATPVWTEGYDGQTHYGAVAKALIPALLILTAATILLLALF